MHLLFLSLIMISMLGCGGGSATNMKTYVSKDQKATLSQENTRTFSQAIYDLNLLQMIIDDITFRDDENPSMLVNDKTDEKTGLGKIEVTLKNFYGISGSVDVTVLGINKDTHYLKYRFSTSNLRLKSQQTDIITDLDYEDANSGETLWAYFKDHSATSQDAIFFDIPRDEGFNAHKFAFGDIDNDGEKELLSKGTLNYIEDETLDTYREKRFKNSNDFGYLNVQALHIKDINHDGKDDIIKVFSKALYVGISKP